MEDQRNRRDDRPYNEKVAAGAAGGIITEYIVEEKDTLADIADRYGVTIEEIIAANEDILHKPADMVQPGLRIMIPKNWTTRLTTAHAGDTESTYIRIKPQMKTASSSEIAKELKTLPPPRLVELCLRLARFKKENKELLSYLLFDAEDLHHYIHLVQTEMTDLLAGINYRHVQYAKKTVRKIVRQTNRYIRYTADRTAEVELLLHFVRQMKPVIQSFPHSAALKKLQDGQIKKIRAALDTLHEDLQHDYLQKINALDS